MTPDNDLLQQGINAVRSGNKRDGAERLARVVQQDPRNAEAWFWLAAATDDQKEAAACLRRALKIDPNHTRARQALEGLEGGSAGSDTIVSPLVGGTPYDTAPQNMRPLNTGELLGSSGTGFDTPYSSFSPSPAPRADMPTRSMPAVAPAGFGDPLTPPPPIASDPTPPPPFGMPAWANQQASASGAPARPPVPDPYANAGMPGMAVPPPPFAMGGSGLSYTQLDPAAAQAAAEAQAQAAQPFDPNADLRSKLLGANAPQPQPQPPLNQPKTFTPDPVKKQDPTMKKRARFNPILLIAVILVLLLLGVAALILTRQNPPTEVISTVTDTATVQAGTPSPGATTTVAATTTAAATTAGGVTTSALSAATTAPATTAANTTAAVTTSAATTTAAVPATTTARATTAAGVPTPTLPGSVGTSAAPVPTPTVVKTLAPQTTVASGGPSAPIEVQSYVNDSGTMLNALGFIEDNINRLVIQPYRDGKFKDNPYVRNQELDYYMLEMGQIGRRLKDTRAPEGAYELATLTNDYAGHLTDMMNQIDSYLSTGQDTYLGRAATYYDKAKSERQLWLKVVQAGYPYKVPLASSNSSN